MPPSRKPVIWALAWDEHNLEHVGNHVDPELVERLIEDGTYVAVPNDERRTSPRWRLIGITDDGQWLTVILEEPADGDPARWRPITAFRPSQWERDMFHRLQFGTRGRR